MRVRVGGVGGDPQHNCATANAGGPGGFNGGGNGGDSTQVAANGVAGAGGGGASDIRVGGDNLGNRILVAGGGGGSSPTTAPGGAGGGLTGVAGNVSTSCGLTFRGEPGGPGTQAQGGAGGAAAAMGSGQAGSVGSVGIGGRGGDDPGRGTGGGGGGRYGGGGGGTGACGGSGGGGSGFVVPGATNVVNEAGGRAGNGRVVIDVVPTLTGTPPSPARLAAPYDFTFATTGSPTVTLVDGALPPGLAVAANGRISGVPTVSGTYTFTLRGSNGAAFDADLGPLTIVVGAGPAGASRFVPLAPVRVLDTRSGLGAAQAPVASDTAIDLQVTGVGGVPATDVVAVALNLTATNTTLPGFVTAWPTGTLRPTVSNLNVTHADQTIPNFVVVRVGASGRVSLYALQQLDLVADVMGYWTQAEIATAGRYVPAGPVRVLDTRAGLGAPHAPVPGNGSITVQITGTPGVPATGVAAVVLNVTATNATGPGFVTLWPSDQPQPLASALNLERVGQTIPNFAIVPVSPDGKVSFFSSRATDLVADVLGYFTDATAPLGDEGLFVPLDPARILDTRQAPANTIQLVTSSSLQQDLQVAGRGGVPTVGVAAVIANVTATNAAAPGFVTVYPSGTATPLASNLNLETAGQTIPNLALARLGSGGRVSFYTIMDVDLIFDVAGWFTGSLA